MNTWLRSEASDEYRQKLWACYIVRCIYCLRWGQWWGAYLVREFQPVFGLTWAAGLILDFDRILVSLGIVICAMHCGPWGRLHAQKWSLEGRMISWRPEMLVGSMTQRFSRVEEEPSLDLALFFFYLFPLMCSSGVTISALEQFVGRQIATQHVRWLLIGWHPLHNENQFRKREDGTCTTLSNGSKVTAGISFCLTGWARRWSSVCAVPCMTVRLHLLLSQLAWSMKRRISVSVSWSL